MSNMIKKVAVYILLGIFAVGLFSNIGSALLTAEAEGTPGQLNQTERMYRLGPYSIYNQVYFADRIVTSTVKELRPGTEYTDVVISVDEWLKNPLPKGEITVRVEQGTNATAGAANFSVGEKTLLMLEDAEVEKGIFILLYRDLGKHPVSDRDEVIVIIDKLLSPVATTPPIKTETWSSEEKMLVVGDTWENEGWKLSIKAVDKTAAPYFILISSSYQGKELEDARIETGKSITFRGRNPDGSEVSLFTAKVVNIFVGAGADAVRLKLDWTTPMSGVQLIEAPVESEMEAETSAPTPTAQASPEAPGFGIMLAVISSLVVTICRRKP